MALSGAQALLFDVFGTVVDWQGSVSRELAARNPHLNDGKTTIRAYPSLTQASLTQLAPASLHCSRLGGVREGMALRIQR